MVAGTVLAADRGGAHGHGFEINHFGRQGAGFSRTFAVN
jgi:hypothetical protein